jgi:Zn-dependent peptidase ImmA (M78 family)
MRGAPVSGVEPALLRWARESANMSTAEVAEKLKKTADEIEAWEAGDGAPSYPQLEKLAYDLYKRPLAMFFLPGPPAEPSIKTEFRSLPDSDLSALGRDTLLLIRKARAWQFALEEIFPDRSPAERPIWRTIRLSHSRSLAEQASALRTELDVTLDQQREWQDDDTALKQWRRAIEAHGVFVFKHSFKQREISGFCLKHPNVPVVMLNNSTTKTRQTFSLLHELAHLLYDRNGISTFDERPIERLPAQDRAIERFCNAFAAEVLVPMSDFRSQTRSWTGDIEQLGEAQFAVLAQRYHVSRAVVLRRFLDEKRVSQTFYETRSSTWDAQQKKEGGGGSYYLTQNAYLSERFLREVFARYARRQISRDDAAELIGVAPKNLAKLEDQVLRGAAA